MSEELTAMEDVYAEDEYETEVDTVEEAPCGDVPDTSDEQHALAPAAVDAEAAMIDRLAEEYLVLCAELPTVGAFDALPPSVLAQAASGKSLAEAYYRHAYLEKCRVEDERQRQAAARAAATGSLAGEAVTGVTSAEAAMLRGIWGERL